MSIGRCFWQQSCLTDGAAVRVTSHSKLAKNSALYFPYTGVQKKCGNRRKYGAKLDYQQIPAKYRKTCVSAEGVRTEIYQMALGSKAFPDLLNLVVIVKTKLATQQRTHVVLFSSDPALEADKLILYYRLRFQLEFNFRDAKQFWGLEDFMIVRLFHRFSSIGAVNC